MKNLVVIIMLLTVSMAYAANGNDKFIKAMQSSIESLYGANTADENLAAVKKLERIAQAEPEKWEPRYYAAFGYVRVSDRTEEAAKKDEYLNLALEIIDEALKIAPEESELRVMKGYVYTMQLMVDPMTRGQQYSGMAFNEYSKALELNNENPRAWYMYGSMQMGTARFMGTGTAEACKSYDTALTKFENFKSDNPLAPKWGLESLKKAMQECGN